MAWNRDIFTLLFYFFTIKTNGCNNIYMSSGPHKKCMEYFSESTKFESREMLINIVAKVSHNFPSSLKIMP
jgi:hypothetical protein